MSWPIINSPEDLPEDGRYDRMHTEWLIAEGRIDREDFDLQMRLTRGNRSARLKAEEDWEAYEQGRDFKPEVKYNPKAKTFTKGNLTWLQRTVPLKRGKHRKD